MDSRAFQFTFLIAPLGHLVRPEWPLYRDRLHIDAAINLQRDILQSQRMHRASGKQDLQIGLVCEVGQRADEILKHRGFNRDPSANDGSAST